MTLWREIANSEEELQNTALFARNKKAEEVFNVLKKIKDITFEEGDYLLRYNAEWDFDSDTDDKKWKLELFSDTNTSPRKYKVVYVDEVGLPYIQKVLFNGGMSGSAVCLAGFDLDWVKFVHDPDFVDHHLLADESDQFDPLDVYREKRRERKKTK